MRDSVFQGSEAFQALMNEFDGRFGNANRSALFQALDSTPELIGEILDSLANGGNDVLRHNIFFLVALKQYIELNDTPVTLAQIDNLVIALNNLAIAAGSAFNTLKIFKEYSARKRLDKEI